MLHVFAEKEFCGASPLGIAVNDDSGRRLTVCDWLDGVVLRITDADGFGQHITLDAGQAKALRKSLKGLSDV